MKYNFLYIIAISLLCFACSSNDGVNNVEEIDDTIFYLSGTDNVVAKVVNNRTMPIKEYIGKSWKVEKDISIIVEGYEIMETKIDGFAYFVVEGIVEADDVENQIHYRIAYPITKEKNSLQAVIHRCKSMGGSIITACSCCSFATGDDGKITGCKCCSFGFCEHEIETTESIAPIW